jgi:hypothetical protein
MAEPRVPRLDDQSTETKTSGRGLRLVEDGRLASEGQAPWRAASGVALHLRSGRVQSGAHLESGGGAT